MYVKFDVDFQQQQKKEAHYITWLPVEYIGYMACNTLVP